MSKIASKHEQRLDLRIPHHSRRALYRSRLRLLKLIGTYIAASGKPLENL